MSKEKISQRFMLANFLSMGGAFFVYLGVISFINHLALNDSKMALYRNYWLIFILGTALPLLLSFHQVWQFARAIKADLVFEENSCAYVKRIAFLARLDVIYFLLGVLVLTALGMLPKSLPLYLLIVFILILGLVISIVFDTIYLYLQSASQIKAENDLTV